MKRYILKINRRTCRQAVIAASPKNPDVARLARDHRTKPATILKLLVAGSDLRDANYSYRILPIR